MVPVLRSAPPRRNRPSDGPGVGCELGGDLLAARVAPALPAGSRLGVPCREEVTAAPT